VALKSHSEALSPSRGSSGLANWAGLHAENAAGALGRLARQPFASLMTILVIAITLALPAALQLSIKNAASISRSWDNALDFSLYLKESVSLAEAERLADIIAQRADVESVRLIPADQALETFKVESGFGDALDSLATNPLPHTLIVRPGSINTEPMVLLLNEELANLPEADFVQVDTEWVQRFLAILEILQRAIMIGSVLLGAAIVVIIGNTIRLDIQNRREEIEVTKLIGASNAFVRRPFLYTGLWYGLGGGLAALGLVAYGLYALREPARRLAGLYGSSYEILALSLVESLGIVGIGVGLGLAGSWLAAARHMRKIEPR
jgi:cell division transport system permease protein